MNDVPGRHDHGASGASDRRLLGTVALNVLLTVAQVIGGAVAGSVSLVADALHNLNDAMALAIVYVARRVARRAPDRRRTFGYERAQVVGATINLVALGVVGLFLGYESLLRFLDPREVAGWPMIVLAGVAFVVDLGTVLLLTGVRRGSVDLRAAFVHNVTDTAASVAVLLGGIAILTLGWTWVDPTLSLVIVGYILWQVATMLPESVRVLMQSVPPDVDVDEVADAILAVDGARGVHHLHAWMLDEERTAVEAHVVIDHDDAVRMDAIKDAIRSALRERFGIGHATLELEFPETAAAAGHDTSLIAHERRGRASKNV